MSIILSARHTPGAFIPFFVFEQIRIKLIYIYIKKKINEKTYKKLINLT